MCCLKTTMQTYNQKISTIFNACLFHSFFCYDSWTLTGSFFVQLSNITNNDPLLSMFLDTCLLILFLILAQLFSILSYVLLPLIYIYIYTCLYQLHLLLQEHKLYNHKVNFSNHKVSFLTTKSLEKNKNFGNLRDTLQKRYRFKQNTIDFRTSTEEKRVKNKVKFEKHEKIQFLYLKTTKSKFLNHKVQTPESSYYHKICRLYAFRIEKHRFCKVFFHAQ